MFYYALPENQARLTALTRDTLLNFPLELLDLIHQYTFFKKPNPSFITEGNFVTQHFYNEEKISEYRENASHFFKTVGNIGSFGSVLAKEILCSLGVVDNKLATVVFNSTPKTPLDLLFNLAENWPKNGNARYLVMFIPIFTDNATERGHVLLVVLDRTLEDKKVVETLARELLGYSTEQLSKLVSEGVLIEVNYAG